jgi:hypothetical protein
MHLQAGNWRGWRKVYGVDTQYRAWRGPLQFTMQGEILTVQAHVRYWIKAHKQVLGTLDLESCCGVDEPPRQAIIDGIKCTDHLVFALVSLYFSHTRIYI